MVKDGKTYRIVSDERGSPRLIVNSETGEVAQELEYDFYGRVNKDTNPGFQPFGKLRRRPLRLRHRPNPLRH